MYSNKGHLFPKIYSFFIHEITKMKIGSSGLQIKHNIKSISISILFTKSDFYCRAALVWCHWILYGYKCRLLLIVCSALEHFKPDSAASLQKDFLKNYRNCDKIFSSNNSLFVANIARSSCLSFGICWKLHE